jgi:hypothetical protein
LNLELYLPTEKQLLDEMKKEIWSFEEGEKK